MFRLLDNLRKAATAGAIEWNRHALVRMAERNIMRADIIATLLKGDVIESYPNARPFPSCLMLGLAAGKPLHVVSAFDEKQNKTFVITSYEPDLKYFEPDFRTRRKP